LSSAKKFGILKQRFAAEDTSKAVKLRFQLAGEDY